MMTHSPDLVVLNVINLIALTCFLLNLTVFTAIAVPRFLRRRELNTILVCAPGLAKDTINNSIFAPFVELTYNFAELAALGICKINKKYRDPRLFTDYEFYKILNDIMTTTSKYDFQNDREVKQFTQNVTEHPATTETQLHDQYTEYVRLRERVYIDFLTARR